MISPDDLARAELRARQGSGARYDDPEAPHEALKLARSGTAYFARLLANLGDDALADASANPKFSRRRVVASVGLQARLLAEAIGSARAGVARLNFSITPSNDDIELASTLPAQALRNLFAHSEVHLNVEWRDLLRDQWRVVLYDCAGSELRIASTPEMRGRELWRSSFDLFAGARKADLPTQLSGNSTEPQSPHILRGSTVALACQY